MAEISGKILGDCEVQELLGKGGMGAVYKAHHLTLDIPVAVKTVDETLIINDPTFIDRFYREARQAANLNHPNVMRVYNVGEQDGLHFLIIEYIDGPSLKDIVKKKGKLSPEAALPLMIQALNGLQHAHSKGILHRDIKPDNLMINSEGILKITDFGLAKPKEPDDSIALTGTGQILGTPAFMPIEQWEAQDLDERADIYAMGVTFYQLLSGEFPVEGKTPVEVITKLVSGTRKPLHIAAPDLPEYLVKVINKMTAIKAENRFASCQTVIPHLKKVMASLKAEKLKQAKQDFVQMTLTLHEEQIAIAKTKAETAKTRAETSAQSSKLENSNLPATDKAVREPTYQARAKSAPQNLDMPAKKSSALKAVFIILLLLLLGAGSAIAFLLTNKKNSSQTPDKTFAQKTDAKTQKTLKTQKTNLKTQKTENTTDVNPTKPLVKPVVKTAKTQKITLPKPDVHIELPTGLGRLDTPAGLIFRKIKKSLAEKEINKALRKLEELKILRPKSRFYKFSRALVFNAIAQKAKTLAEAGKYKEAKKQLELFAPFLKDFEYKAQWTELHGKIELLIKQEKIDNLRKELAQTVDTDILEARKILQKLEILLGNTAEIKQWREYIDKKIELLASAIAQKIDKLLKTKKFEQSEIEKNLQQLAKLGANAQKTALEKKFEERNLEEEFYQKAKNGDNSSCVEYLKKYPDGLHADEIREMVALYEKQKDEELAYRKALAGTVADCDKYLAKYPRGKFASQVELAKQQKLKAIETAAYNKAKLGTIEQMRAFLKKYPDSEYAKQIRHLIALREQQQKQEQEKLRAEQDAYINAKVGTIEDCKKYLEKFPTGKHSDEIRKLLKQREKQLQLRKLEQAAFQKAKLGSPKNCIEFLRRYPKSKNAHEIAKRLDSFLTSPIKTLRGHSNKVYTIAFSPDSKTLASASWDKTLKLWDTHFGKVLCTLTGHKHYVFSFAFLAKGKALVSASADKTVKFWQTKDGKLLASLPMPANHYVFTIAVAPNQKTFATGSSDKTIKIWSIATAKTIFTLTGHKDYIEKVAFAPNGATLASASDDKTVKLWNPQTGKLVKTLNFEDIAYSVDYSPDGKFFACAIANKRVFIYDAKTYKLRRTLKTQDKPVALKFSPDTKSLVVAAGKNLQLFDVQTGALIRTLRGHKKKILAVDYSPDARLIAAGAEGSTIKLWATRKYYEQSK